MIYLQLEFAEWAYSLLQSREPETHLASNGIKTTKKEAGAWQNETRANELNQKIYRNKEHKSRDLDKFYDPNYIGHHTLKHLIDASFGEAQAMRDMLNHNASREFMSSISGERIVRCARASN